MVRHVVYLYWLSADIGAKCCSLGSSADGSLSEHMWLLPAVAGCALLDPMVLPADL